MESSSIVGRRVHIIDGKEKVTGKAKYTTDINLPGMLYGKILRSPYAHAKILNINVEKARSLPGVKSVITAEDTPKIKSIVLGPPFEDKLPLADKKVRYIGDEVAAVAAINEDISLEALNLIEVEYEELPAVFDPEEAMKPNAPLIHEVERNIAAHTVRNYGDVERGFKESDLIVEDSYSTQAVAHCCLEPHGTVAEWDLDGNLNIWSATQCSFWIRREIAHMLSLPLTKVHVREIFVGGGFGGRSKISDDEVICAILAKKSDRPVKIILSRGEEFSTTRIRHPMKIYLKTGVRKDGTLLSREMKIITDNGAYNNVGPAVTGFGGVIAASLYRLKNFKLEGYTVYTNKQFGGPFQGYGSPQVTFAIESQMDKIAERLNIDPVDLRLMNANQSGDTTPCGWKITSCGHSDCIREASAAIGWEEKKNQKSPNRGIGIASLIHVSGAKVYVDIGDYSSAIIYVNDDGKVHIFSGITDTGTWSKTTIGQIVAEELGVKMEDIRVSTMDTEMNPVDLGSFASRVCFIAGNAVKRAASDAKDQLLRVASDALRTSTNDLIISEGKIIIKNSQHKYISIGDAVALSKEKIGKAVIGKGHYDPPSESYNRETGYANLSAAYTFAAHAVEVEVEPQLGTVRITKFVAAHDVGKAINPTAIEGQIEGAVLKGLGYALMEKCVYENGNMRNPSFVDYKIPHSTEMVKVENILVETNDPEGPFGAKGVGEPPLVPVAPAIANAIYDAIGVRIRELPITPEKIKKALKDKESRTLSIGT